MQKINFQDLPNTTTPLNASNLNAIQTNAETAIGEVNTALNTGLAGKVNNTTLNNYVNGNTPMENIVIGNITNKNIIGSWFTGWLSTTDGSEIESSNARRTDFIEVDFTKHSDYIFSGLPTATYRNCALAYNASKQFLGRTGESISSDGLRGINSEVFTAGTPQGTGAIKYIRMSIRDSVTDSSLGNIQLEVGSTPTSHTAGDSYGYHSGNTPYGSFVKYNDGRLECWNEVTQSNLAITNASGGLYASDIITPFPNFPVAFVSRPQIFISSQCHSQYVSFVMKAYPPSQTSPNDLRVYGTWSSTQNVVLSYHAIGRWK